MQCKCLATLALCASFAHAAQAQIGKNVPIKAGTPEDKALAEINAEKEPAQKLALMEKFVADFKDSDMVLVGYDLLVNYYLGAKNYDKAFENGDKLFAADPDNFANGVNMVRAALEKGDVAKLFDYGEKTGNIVARYRAQGPPEGTSAENWAQQKQQTLSDVKDNLTYVEQSLFSAAYKTTDAQTKPVLLARFASAFPESQYALPAMEIAATSYQQAQNYPKMLETANKVLDRDPDNLSMFILLSDYYSEKGEQLDKAESYAKKAIELVGTAKKPEGVTDQQWEQQLALQKGLALSSLGEIYINRKRDTQALESFKTAAPLLKADAFTYGRNQYRMGFALINLKRTAEARVALTEAASINSPYKALALEKLKELPPGRTVRKKS
jgi:tetratricopeptide (TPR) repeat protein